MIFALFQNYIVTANADGSIPLNAKVVCQIGESADHELLAKLILQANGFAFPSKTVRPHTSWPDQEQL